MVSTFNSLLNSHNSCFLSNLLLKTYFLRNNLTICFDCVSRRSNSIGRLSEPVEEEHDQYLELKSLTEELEKKVKIHVV